MNNHVNKSRAAAAAAAAKAEAASKVAESATKAVQFITQRREALVTSIIYNAVASKGCPKSEEAINGLANDAVDLADAVIRRLYGNQGRDEIGKMAQECFGAPEMTNKDGK